MTNYFQKPDRTAKLIAASSSYHSSVGFGIFDNNEVTATLQDGHMTLDALDESRFFVLRGSNQTASTIAANKLVYQSGWDSLNNTSLISLADNSVPNYALGFVLRDIVDSSIGHVAISGLMEGVNTLAASPGDPVYLGTNGDFVFAQPANSQQIGVVLNSDAVNGVILVDVAVFSVAAAPVSSEFPSPEDFGAANDNSSNDSQPVQDCINAVGSGGIMRLRKGAGYRIVTPLVAPSGGLTIVGEGAGVSRLTTAKSWQNAPVIDFQGDGNSGRYFSIEEDSAEATDSLKSGSQNAGIGLNSKFNNLQGVHVVGFGFGIFMRDVAQTGQANGNTIVDCAFSKAYSWGVEVDSAENTTICRTRAFENGLDGFKLQQENAGPPVDFVGDRLLGYLNGQRNPNAGGDPGDAGVNGNGIDIWNGAYRWRLTNSWFFQNFGSGLYAKGDPPLTFPLGQGSAVNCHFLDAAAIDTGVQHGVNIETTPNDSIHLSVCTMSGNTGDGIKLRDAHSTTISACNLIENKRYGVFFDGGYDNQLLNSNVFGSLGIFGVRVGNSNDGSQVSRRHKIIGTRISGNYDENLGGSEDPRNSRTAVVTQRGIQIYDDTADTLVEDVHIYNVRDYLIRNYGKGTIINRLDAYDVPSFGVINEAQGDITITNAKLKHGLFEIDFTGGSGTEPVPGNETITGTISTASGILKAITISSGSFATSDAVGTLYVYEATGEFNATEPLLASGGGSMTASSISTPIFIRSFGGRTIITDNKVSLESVRASAIPIYVDDTVDYLRYDSNQVENFNQSVVIEAGATIGYDNLGVQPSVASVDFSSGNYRSKEIQLSADTTVSLSDSIGIGGPCDLRVRQDLTGGRSLTISSSNVSPSMTLVPLDPTPGSLTVINFDYDKIAGVFNWG